MSDTAEYPIVIVTGISGAGKTTILKVFEDFGYETIDNIPLAFLRQVIASRHRPLVIDIDIRTRDFSVPLFMNCLDSILDSVTEKDKLSIIFTDSDNAVIEKRYRETRRQHPLSANKDEPIRASIAKERALLQPLKDIADHVLDTSLMSPPKLREYMHFLIRGGRISGINILALSFSYKIGIPREADMVFDMRFLDNPYYIEAMRDLCGKDEVVKDHLLRDGTFVAFFAQLQKLMELIIKKMESDGRSKLVIAFGCTGGQHRSVFTAEHTHHWLLTNGYTSSVSHRDL